MAPLLKYSVLRLGLFVAVLAVLSLLGMRGIGVVVAAALVSLALSYLLLRGPREEAATRLQERISGRLGDGGRRQDQDAAAEDSEDDARRG